MNKRSIGIWGAVPIALLQEDGVTGSAIKVYTALASFQGGADNCWPSKEEIMARAGMNNRQAYHSGLTWLKGNGWIECVQRGLGKTNVYRVRVDVLEPEGLKTSLSEGLKTSPSLYITKTTIEKNKPPKPDRTIPHPTLTIPINQARYDTLVGEYSKLMVDNAIQERLDWESANGKPRAKDYAAAAANWLKKSKEFGKLPELNDGLKPYEEDL